MLGAYGGGERLAALARVELRLHEGAEVVDGSVFASRRASAVENDSRVGRWEARSPHGVEHRVDIGVGDAFLPRFRGNDRQLRGGKDVVNPGGHLRRERGTRSDSEGQREQQPGGTHASPPKGRLRT
jgi:hypothetical protein